MDVEICSWGKGVVRSGRFGCIYKVFKRDEDKSVAIKSAPWLIPKRYKESEHKENVKTVERREFKERN